MNQDTLMPVAKKAIRLFLVRLDTTELALRIANDRVKLKDSLNMNLVAQNVRLSSMNDSVVIENRLLKSERDFEKQKTSFYQNETEKEKERTNQIIKDGGGWKDFALTTQKKLIKMSLTTGIAIGAAAVAIFLKLL